MARSRKRKKEDNVNSNSKNARHLSNNEKESYLNTEDPPKESNINEFGKEKLTLFIVEAKGIQGGPGVDVTEQSFNQRTYYDAW